MTAPFVLPSLGPRSLVQQTAQKTDAPSDLRMGVITAVTRYGVVIDVAGGLLEAAYLDSFMPSVGQTVVCQRFQDSWIVLGRPVGTGTDQSGAVQGTGGGLTLLSGVHTSGNATLATSTGAEVPVPGYSLTFHHPANHSVLLLIGYSWYSNQSADWGIFRVREGGAATGVGEWVEPIITNLYGRYGTWQAIASPAFAGQQRTYYLTLQRLAGAGTTTISKNDGNRGFFLAVDVGDAALVPAI